MAVIGPMITIAGTAGLSQLDRHVTDAQIWGLLFLTGEKSLSTSWHTHHISPCASTAICFYRLIPTLGFAGAGIGLFNAPNGMAQMLSVPATLRGVAASVSCHYHTWHV